MPPRIAFSTLAFPDATLAAAVSAGRRWGYSGVELRLGKIPVGAPIGPELDRMRRVAAAARELGTTIVRAFSFFIPAGEPPGRYRAQVIDRMAALAEIAAGQGLVMAHENEKEIFGDT